MVVTTRSQMAKRKRKKEKLNKTYKKLMERNGYDYDSDMDIDEEEESIGALNSVADELRSLVNEMPGGKRFKEVKAKFRELDEKIEARQEAEVKASKMLEGIHKLSRNYAASEQLTKKIQEDRRERMEKLETLTAENEDMTLQMSRYKRRCKDNKKEYQSLFKKYQKLQRKFQRQKKSLTSGTCVTKFLKHEWRNKFKELTEDNLRELVSSSRQLEGKCLEELDNRFSKDRICSICRDQQKNVAFACGHTFCRTCCDRVTECPHCKGPVDFKLQIYN